MVLRNGPKGDGSDSVHGGRAASRRADGQTSGGGGILRRGTKPASLIGCNGFVVSHVELPDGGVGTRIAFACCCEIMPHLSLEPWHLTLILGTPAAPYGGDTWQVRCLGMLSPSES